MVPGAVRQGETKYRNERQGFSQFVHLCGVERFRRDSSMLFLAAVHCLRRKARLVRGVLTRSNRWSSLAEVGMAAIVLVGVERVRSVVKRVSVGSVS